MRCTSCQGDLGTARAVYDSSSRDESKSGLMEIARFVKEKNV